MVLLIKNLMLANGAQIIVKVITGESNQWMSSQSTAYTRKHQSDEISCFYIPPLTDLKDLTVASVIQLNSYVCWSIA